MKPSKTFKQAKLEISNKFNHLILLEFNGNEKPALFLDKDFGEFKTSNYKNVLRGSKNHPKRAKINKKQKYKKTCLEKYGTTTTLLEQNTINKIKQTNLKKYGTENPNSSQIIKNKKRSTILNKYGVDNISQNEKIKNKKKKTNLEKYGVENVFQNKEIKEKIKQTNIKKYGTEYPTQNKNIQEKIKKTNIDRYGVAFLYQNINIKNKSNNTLYNHYKVYNPMYDEKLKNKCLTQLKKTNLKRYNAEYPFQSKKILNKIKKNNLENGKWHNIGGNSLAEHYRNSKLFDIRSYSSIQQSYSKDGYKALKIDYYNKLAGKSKIANKWLDQVEKQIGYSLIREYHIPNTLFHADGYDPKTSTIYEFYGDFWHGNLEKFAAEEINPITKSSFQDLYDKTMERQNKIKNLGYNFVYIWESDL